MGHTGMSLGSRFPVLEAWLRVRRVSNGIGGAGSFNRGKKLELLDILETVFFRGRK